MNYIKHIFVVLAIFLWQIVKIDFHSKSNEHAGFILIFLIVIHLIALFLISIIYLIFLKKRKLIFTLITYVIISGCFILLAKNLIGYYYILENYFIVFCTLELIIISFNKTKKYLSKG